MADLPIFLRTYQTEQQDMFPNSSGRLTTAATHSSASEFSSLPRMTVVKEYRAANITMPQMTRHSYLPISQSDQPNTICEPCESTPDCGRLSGATYGVPILQHLQPAYSQRPLKEDALAVSSNTSSPYENHPGQYYTWVAFEPDEPIPRRKQRRRKRATHMAPYNPLSIRRWQCCRCLTSKGYYGSRFGRFVCNTCQHLRCTECIDSRADGSQIQTCGGLLLAEDRKKAYEPSIGGMSQSQRTGIRATAASLAANASSPAQQTALIPTARDGVPAPPISLACVRESKPFSDRLRETNGTSISGTREADGFQEMQAAIRDFLNVTSPVTTEISQARENTADKKPTESDSRNM